MRQDSKDQNQLENIPDLQHPYRKCTRFAASACFAPGCGRHSTFTESARFSNSTIGLQGKGALGKLGSRPLCKKQWEMGMAWQLKLEASQHLGISEQVAVCYYWAPWVKVPCLEKYGEIQFPRFPQTIYMGILHCDIIHLYKIPV